MGMTLGDEGKRFCLGNHQIRESLAYGCIMDRERNFPLFSGCKGDGGRSVLSDSINIVLQ